MIPKRIIYCWFGGKEKPANVINCMNTWKEKLKGYEFLELNESNFDVNINEYCKKAYDTKHWAYVSDVARLWGLYNYGGIYMDTDVEVYKPLDEFLKYDFFTGFEQKHFPITATMGANKGNWLIKEMLDTYNTKNFETHDKWTEYETNTMILSDILGKYFDRDKEENQEHDNMAIFTKDIFCQGGSNAYTRHLMFGNWCER